MIAVRRVAILMLTEHSTFDILTCIHTNPTNFPQMYLWNLLLDVLLLYFTAPHKMLPVVYFIRVLHLDAHYYGNGICIVYNIAELDSACSGVKWHPFSLCRFKHYKQCPPSN